MRTAQEMLSVCRRSCRVIFTLKKLAHLLYFPIQIIHLLYKVTICSYNSVFYVYTQDHYKDQPYPPVVQLYGGLEDHVVDEFGFRTPICSENQGFTATARRTLLNLIALNKKQPDWVPKFTAVGFEKVPVPAEIYSNLLTEYDKVKSKPSPESCSSALINCEKIISNEDLKQSQLEETQQTYMMILR